MRLVSRKSGNPDPFLHLGSRSSLKNDTQMETKQNRNHNWETPKLGSGVLLVFLGFLHNFSLQKSRYGCHSCFRLPQNTIRQPHFSLLDHPKGHSSQRGHQKVMFKPNAEISFPGCVLEGTFCQVGFTGNRKTHPIFGEKGGGGGQSVHAVRTDQYSWPPTDQG